MAVTRGCARGRTSTCSSRTRRRSRRSCLPPGSSRSATPWTTRTAIICALSRTRPCRSPSRCIGARKWPTRRTPAFDEIAAEAVPSVLDVPGVLAPSAAHHAVLMAGHAWEHDPLSRVGLLADIAAIALEADPDDIDAAARAWGVSRDMVGHRVGDRPAPARSPARLSLADLAPPLVRDARADGLRGSHRASRRPSCRRARHRRPGRRDARDLEHAAAGTGRDLDPEAPAVTALRASRVLAGIRTPSAHSRED